MTDTRTLLAGMAMPACLAQVWAKTNKERVEFGPDQKPAPSLERLAALPERK